MFSLYKMSEKYRRTLEELYSSDEITEDMEKRLIDDMDDFKEACINKYYLIKELEVQQAMVDEEVKNLKSRSNLIKEKIEKIENSIITHMEVNEVKIINTPLFDLSIQENRERVVIDDENSIDRKFFKQKLTESISLTDIHNAIKNGEKVNGIHMERGKKIKVKYGKNIESNS